MDLKHRREGRGRQVEISDPDKDIASVVNLRDVFSSTYEYIDQALVVAAMMLYQRDCKADVIDEAGRMADLVETAIELQKMRRRRNQGVPPQQAQAVFDKAPETRSMSTDGAEAGITTLFGKEVVDKLQLLKTTHPDHYEKVMLAAADAARLHSTISAADLKRGK